MGNNQHGFDGMGFEVTKRVGAKGKKNGRGRARRLRQKKKEGAREKKKGGMGNRHNRQKQGEGRGRIGTHKGEILTINERGLSTPQKMSCR